MAYPERKQRKRNTERQRQHDRDRVQVALKLRRQHHVHEDGREQKSQDEAPLQFVEHFGPPRELEEVPGFHLDPAQLRLQGRGSVTNTDVVVQICDERDLTLAALALDGCGTDVFFEPGEIRQLHLSKAVRGNPEILDLLRTVAVFGQQS